MSDLLNMLAFDLGAESGRAILGKFDGVRISLADIHRFTNQPVELPDGLHWNVLGLWQEIKHGLALASRQTGNSIASLGVDTWGVDFGLLDKQDILIGNPYHYRDSRTDGMMEEAYKIVPRQDIYFQTGIQFMQLNTLYQLLAMVKQKSVALDIAEELLMMPDLINFWFTGRKACEFSDTTTTQCFDTRKNSWAFTMLDRLGIPTHIFKEIVQSGTVLGNLRPAITAECEVGSIPVIAPATHDTGSAVAAVPASGSGFAWISSGTWSIMGIETDAPVVSPESLAYGITNEGGVGHTYRVSKNIMGLWPVQESRRTWARHGNEMSYDEITRMAAEAPSLQSVVNIDHHDFLKPGDMPSRLQNYCRETRQPIPEDPGQIVRCTLEGVALKYRDTLESLEKLAGHKIETVHIVGGGTRNQLLSQFAADAMDRTVVAGPIEATATGNLLVQAMALGKLSSIQEIREVVRNSFDVITFAPSANRTKWDDAYARLRQLP